MLGEVGTFTKGAPLSKADISEEGTPFILYGELYTTYNEVTTTIVRKTDKAADSSQYSRIGDVIIPTSGETPEEIATATCVMLPNVILAGDLNIFRGTKVDGRIISYIINHIVNQDISRIAQGKSVVHIKADELSKIRINYPNAEEQKKLIRFFEILSARIEKQRLLVEALKSYKRGALSKLFPKKGESAPQYRFAGFTKPWTQRKLGEVGKARSGVGFPDTEQGGKVGFPFFKVSDMNNVGNESEMTTANNYVTDEQIASHRWRLIKDLPAIFFAKVGAAVMLNRKRLCLSPFLLDNNTMAYSLNPKAWNADFAKALFETIDLTSLVQVGALPSYNTGDLEVLEISLPELKEQEQIGAFFLSLDNLITLHQCELNEFQESKSGLLQQLFI